ncbi:MAG TPA: MFS transporter [Thermoplasmata archaeon]|nr:MFS transporter [Thermoplasmata archaeon]
MQYKWRALGIVNIGTLMGSIDSTVLLIAFPQIARDLSASLVDMVWVLMVYILMGTAFVLSLGRVADMKGRKRLYNAGFVVFLVGSAICGLSQNGLELIGARALQGIGGAMLFANAFAILSDAFPPDERGRAFGVNTIVWGSGSIFGIVLGGIILSFTTWRWIFWINVPIGLVGTALAYVFLRESVTPNPRDTFDFPAAALFTVSLAAFLLGATEGVLGHWSDAASLVPLGVAIPLMIGFVLWELRISRDPILPFSLFRSWLFSASLTSSMLQGVAIFAANFLLMIYFQGIRGIDVLTAAYLLVPLSLGLSLVGPLGGKLSDRYGARVLSTIGLAIQAGVLVLLGLITASTPLYVVALYEGLLGVGGGLFFPANTSAIMASAPRRRFGVASGVMMTFRNASMSLSFALALVALTSQLPAQLGPALFGGAFTPQLVAGLGLSTAQLDALFVRGMGVAFDAAAVFLGLAAAFSAFRGRELRSGTDDYRRRPTVPVPAFGHSPASLPWGAEEGVTLDR